MSFSGLLTTLIPFYIIALIAVIVFLVVKNQKKTNPIQNKANPTSTSLKVKSNKQFLGIAFIVVAGISFILALAASTLSVGSSEYNQSYGGDAYTGIQNAAAQTATNLVYTNEIIKHIAFGVFIILGSILAIIGIYFILESQKENAEAQKTNTQNNQNFYNPHSNNFGRDNFNQDNYNQEYPNDYYNP